VPEVLADVVEVLADVVEVLAATEPGELADVVPTALGDVMLTVLPSAGPDPAPMSRAAAAAPAIAPRLRQRRAWA
jgi:hypothetical protein